MKNRSLILFLTFLTCGAISIPALGQYAIQSRCLIQLNGDVVNADSIQPVMESSNSGSAPTLQFEFTQAGESHLMPASQVFAAKLHPWDTITILSDTEAKALSLGDASKNTPAPDGWERQPVVDGTLWSNAIATVNANCMLYQPGAQWIWSPAGNYDKPSFERVLFQKPFDIPAELSIVQGIISLSGCHEVAALYINGQKINADNDELCLTLVKYDVTNAIKSGTNLIAIDTLAPADESHGYGGLSFRLDVTVHKNGGTTATSSGVPNCALLLSTNDVIKGELLEISNKAFVIRHAAGTANISREWIDSAQFVDPGRISANTINPALSDKGGCGMHTSSYSSARLAADTHLPARIVDRYGRVMAGDVLAMDKNNRLMIEHEPDMPPMMIDLALIQEINFINPRQFAPCELDPSKLPRIVRVMTTDGNIWHGVLEQVRESTLIVNTPYAGEVAFALPHVSEIVFPYQAAATALESAQATDSPRRIAIIGEYDPQPASCTGKVVSSIITISNMLNYEVVKLQTSDVLNKEIFSPKTIKLVINVDERQRAYEGWNKADDLSNALIDFIEQGGNLIHMAPGTPFYLGVRRVDGEWVLNTGVEPVNQKFGLHVASTGENGLNGMCIERPNNFGQLLTFANLDTQNQPYPLPKTFTFTAPRETRFRPVSPDERSPQSANFIPLYNLQSQDGMNYGVAAALNRFPNKAGGTSTVGYVAFPLISSEWENIPAVHFIYPWLLSAINQN